MSQRLKQETETPYNNNLFSNHFLQERLSELDECQETNIEEKFEQLQKHWENTEDYLKTEPNEDNTQQKFLNKILKNILGHYPDLEASKIVSGRELNPDYLFFKDLKHNLDAEESDEDKFQQTYALGEAKRWGRKLDQSQDNHTNPAFQTYNYVDRLRTPWGILTNGRKWRLYSYEDCEADTYYEIDIVKHILKEDDRDQALQNFRYFYLFFRKDSFLPKENGFLDKVFQGSVSYAQGLEEDLEDDIYTALEVTARGFFEANDLEKTEENVEEVHRASLILLYRVLFILNAESRGLLPIEEKKYKRILSLEHLKEALENGKEDAFGEGGWVWRRRIKPLFEAIDSGEQYGDFKITAYNGGLFEPEQHQFLDQHELHGRHIRQVMKLLAESEDEETGDKVLVDYRDLNIRHLGSVYEGLLEHHFKVAEEKMVVDKGEWTSLSDSSKDFSEVEDSKKVEEGEIYLTNESGERKATGSYYTPEYIVEYIVENTVQPKVEEKIEEADSPSEVLEKVLEIDVCDPAMGSGHFLTVATSFIAHQILEHGKIEEDLEEDEDELVWIKRQVVSECIYGVDINPLAVELGKLSLWIETMAEGKPLSFLDHHLKTGNSLVGTDFDEILHHPFSDEQKTLDQDRFQFGSPEDTKERLQQKYKEIEQMPEETVKQVHKKEEKYEEFVREDMLYQQFKQVANIHTYQYFDGELDEADYENFLVHTLGVENFSGYNSEDWFKEAQEDAEQRYYFHWELEFPQVFFGEKEGFDAVVGNPPYISVTNIPSEIRDYISDSFYTAKGRFDTYIVFMEKSIELAEEKGLISKIIPIKWAIYGNGSKFRDLLLERNSLHSLANLSQCEVFRGPTTYPCIPVIEKSKPSQNQSIKIINIPEENPREINEDINQYSHELPINRVKETPDRIICPYMDDLKWNVFSKMKSRGTRLEEIYRIEQAIRMGGKDAREELIVENPEDMENAYPLVDGKNLSKYVINWDGRYLIYEPEKLYNPKSKDLLDQEKILIKRIAEDLTTAYDSGIENKFTFPLNTVYTLTDAENREENYRYHTALLNSNLLDWVYKLLFAAISIRGGYVEFREYLKHLPLRDIDFNSDEKKIHDKLCSKVKKIERSNKKLSNYNTDIKDYLGNYEFGVSLEKLYSPASGVSDTPLTDTASDREKLQVGSVETERNSNSVTLLVSARYKPENQSAHDTDQYGYTETELYPAMEFHNLSETEKALIEEFVPVAVEEAGGFANFRKKATKTNSLIDRLKKLTLPKVSDVKDDLEKFVEQKKKAEELEEKIEKTDQEINKIVYGLYDLTEEEIEVVEEAVNES